MGAVQNMKQVIHLVVLFCVFNLAVFAQTVQRYIAITIDDLPVVTIQDGLSVRQEITKKLLAKITAAKVPAIGFVNENKLYTNGKLDDAKVKLLQAWLDAGNAHQQALRGAYDPGYLNYTLGKLMIRKLRDDWSASRGGEKAWKAFHDQFLSYGGPPIPLVRQQMMGGKAEAVF